MDYIRHLPINDTPEIFGLHDNANITFAQNETFSLLNGILQLQPKSFRWRWSIKRRGRYL